jgi:hypothetical protein
VQKQDEAEKRNSRRDTGRLRHEVGGGEGSAGGKLEVRVAASGVTGLPNDTRVWPGAKTDAVVRPREKGRIPPGFFFSKGALTHHCGCQSEKRSRKTKNKKIGLY